MYIYIYFCLCISYVCLSIYLTRTLLNSLELSSSLTLILTLALNNLYYIYILGEGLIEHLPFENFLPKKLGWFSVCFLYVSFSLSASSLPPSFPSPFTL